MTSSFEPTSTTHTPSTFFTRQDGWPETAFAPTTRLRIPRAFQWAGRSLRLLGVIPFLSDWVAYRWFFRISGRARTASGRGLIDKGARLHHVQLSGRDGSSPKRVQCYSLGDERNPVVVLLHGWEANVNALERLTQDLLDQGFHVVTFDLPAHGVSDGTHTDLLEINAVISALLQNKRNADSAREHQERHKLRCAGIVAHSFGGVCAVRLLADGCQCDSLVLINTPATFRGVFDKFTHLLSLSSRQAMAVKQRIKNRFKPFYPDVWQDFSSVRNLAGFSQHVLVVQDIHDKVVPVHEGERLFRVAQQRQQPCARTQLILSRGLGHNRLMQEPSVTREIAGFLRDTALPAEGVSRAC